MYFIKSNLCCKWSTNCVMLKQIHLMQRLENNILRHKLINDKFEGIEIVNIENKYYDQITSSAKN